MSGFDAFNDLAPSTSDLTGGFSNQNDSEDQARQEKVRQREQERLVRLQQLQAEELEAKKQRREQAKKDLEEMMAARKAESQLKRQNQQTLQGAKATGGDNPVSWNLIMGNIALKNGDYPGNNDVTRMRESIVNKAQDEDNQGDLL